MSIRVGGRWQEALGSHAGGLSKPAPFSRNSIQSLKRRMKMWRRAWWPTISWWHNSAGAIWGMDFFSSILFVWKPPSYHHLGLPLHDNLMNQPQRPRLFFENKDIYTLVADSTQEIHVSWLKNQKVRKKRTRGSMGVITIDRYGMVGAFC